MENYIVEVVAMPGHEDAVTRFYQDLEPLLREAKGFRERTIFRGQTGAMAAAVKELYTEEELAKHPEPPHDDTGTQFVIIEAWDSVEDRILFGKNVQGPRMKDLIGHLTPQHSHEFFEDISVD